MSDNLCAICKQAPRNPLANVCQGCSDEIERRQAQRLVTHHCPACEAAARELDKHVAAYCEKDAARYDAEQEANQAQRELADLRARFTAAIDELRGMAGVMKAQSYLPKTAAAIDERVAELTGEKFQPDDLRARLEALCVEMETDDRAGKLAHWIGAIRALLRKEAK